MRRLRRLLRRDRFEHDLDRELAFHLEEHQRRLEAGGLSPAEARRQARLSLGGVAQVKEATRDVGAARWLTDWWADVRYALRGLRRAPGFAAAAMLTLAIGIGANTAVFGVIDGLLLRSLPVERPAEIELIRRVGLDDANHRGNRFSAAELGQFAAALPDSAHLTSFAPRFRLYATIGDLPETASGQLVAGSWFPFLGVQPAVGRLIGPGDDQGASAAPVVVLSHRYWTSRFGRDPGVVGSTIRVNGAAVTVIGVTEPGFFGVATGETPDLWLPLGLQADLKYLGNASADDADFLKPWWPQAGIRWLWLLTRIPAGQPVASVEARLAQVYRASLEDQLAGADSATREFRLREHVALERADRGVSGLRDQLADPLVALMITVGLVLLITCANLASLLLARSAARRQEMSIRIALGAGRARLVRQVLTESLVLALLGGAASLFVARVGAAALVRSASGPTTPISLEVPFDGRLLAFAAAVSVLTGLLFGLAPALRVAASRPFGELRSAGRAAADRLRAGRALVAGQVALSLVLVVLAALFARTFHHLTTLDPGYARQGLLAARFDSRAAGYRPDQLPALHQRLLDAVRALPGIRSASLSAYAIGSGSSMTMSFDVPGRSHGPEWDPDAQIEYVTPDFFATTGIPIVTGRAFTPADRDSSRRLAVVSRSAARYFFGTEAVVGRRFGFDGTANLEIAGVAADARFNSLTEEPPKMVYLAALQAPEVVMSSVEVRVDGSAAALAPAIRRAIGGVDRSLPVREVASVADLLERQLAERRMAAEMARLFGALALLLAAVGLYGVMTYSVARRTNELGIRIALGAGARGVRWLVLRDTLGIVLVGLAAGLALAWPAANLVRGLLSGVSPRDPASLLLAAGVLLVVGLAAGAVPAWRASRVEPIQALKAD